MPQLHRAPRALARVAAVAVAATSISTGFVGVAHAGTALVSSGGAILNDGPHTITVSAPGVYVPGSTAKLVLKGPPTSDPNDPVGALTATNVSVAIDTHTITGTFDYTRVNPGAWDLEVYPTAGSQSPTDTCTDCVSVNALKPSVTSVSPSSLAGGTTGGGYQGFVLTGTSFARGYYTQCTSTPCTTGPKVAVYKSGTSDLDPNVTLTQTVDSMGASAPTATTATTITLRIAIANGATAQSDDVVVINSDGKSGTCTACLSVLPRPTILSAVLQATGSPSIGQDATGQTVVITGDNFPSDATMSFNKPSNNAGSITSTSISGPVTSNGHQVITVSGVDTTGVTTIGSGWTISVSSPTKHATSASSTFTVNAPPAPTGVTYLDGTAGDFGQGASHVQLRVDFDNTAPFTASSTTPYTTIQLVGAPAGVTVHSETAATGATNSVTAELSIAPGTTTGKYGIVAVNPDGGTTTCADLPGPLNTCVLSIVAGPTITSLAPSTMAGTGSAQQLVINGTGFNNAANGVSVVVGPPASPYFSGTATPDSATKITLPNVVIPATETAKDVDVTVTNVNDRGSVTTGAQQRLHVANLVVTGASPSSGTNDAPVAVTVNGTHFVSGATVQLVRTGSTINGTGITGSGSSLGATFDITDAGPGAYDVVVTNPGGSAYPGTASCVGCFTVVAPAPSVSSVTPSTVGGGATGVSVTISGAHFFPGATVSFSDAKVHVTSTPVVSTTSITFTVSVDSTATAAAGTVTVTNTDGQAASKAFSTAVGPTVTGISPSTRAAGTSFSMTVDGTGFTAGTTLAFDVAGISASNVVINGAGTQLTADVTIGGTVATSAPVPSHVSVVRTDFGRATSPTDLTVDPQPTIGSLTPDHPAAGSSSTLHVLGTGFNAGVTLAPHAGVTGVTISDVQRVSATEITATLTIDPAAAAGARQVDVSNTDGGFVSALLHVINVPTAPTAATATGGLKQVEVDWAAPSSNGGSAVTGYSVVITKHGDATPTDSTQTDGATTTATFTGLADATLYDVTVAASNAAGTSPTAASSATTFGVASAPTSATATAGIKQVDVHWAAPTSNGGTPVTSYKVSLTPNGGAATTFTTPDASTLSHTFTGLTDGTTYTAAITATNAVGPSPAATPAAVTTPAVPTAPTGLTASGDVRQVGVTWGAPVSDGGSAVTSYTAKVVNQANSADSATFTTADASTTSHTFTGLANGATYTVTVLATNALGSSANASGSATTYGLPGAPATFTATGGIREVDLSWSAPTSTGGKPVTGYTVSLQGPSSTTTATVPAGTTSYAFTSLANGTTYTASVRATTLVGDGPALQGTATTLALPGAPTGVTADYDDRSAFVDWTAPTSDGGSPITGYRVTSSPGGKTATVGASAREAKVTGLTNGTSYRFTVTAITAVGETTSTLSNAVVPLGYSDLSFNALPSKVVYGTAITVAGVVSRTDPSVAPTTASLYARYDNGTVVLLKTVAVASNGAYSYRFAPKFNWTYGVVYNGDGKNDLGFSVLRRTLVAARVTATAPSGSHTVNQVVTGSVGPSKAGSTLSLYRVSSTGALTRLQTVKLSSTSTYRFSVRLPRGKTTLRVAIGTTPNNVGGSKQLVATRT